MKQLYSKHISIYALKNRDNFAHADSDRFTRSASQHTFHHPSTKISFGQRKMQHFAIKLFDILPLTINTMKKPTSKEVLRYGLWTREGRVDTLLQSNKD